MKFISVVIFTLITVSCGTNVKVSDSSQPLKISDEKVPVLLVYNIDNRLFEYTPRHEIYFFDGNAKRTNVRVPTSFDLSKGVLVYLKANSAYAMSGINVWGTSHGLIELNKSIAFKTQPGKVNVVILPKISFSKTTSSDVFLDPLDADFYLPAISHFKKQHALKNNDLKEVKVIY